MSARTSGQVHIIGAGLLGTSIGLALSKLGVKVTLEDLSKSTTKLAVDFAAGDYYQEGDVVNLVIVCVPPDATTEKVIEALERFPQAVVTDVSSVKSAILESVRGSNQESFRYVGSHPMAGREKGGALNARPDLFVGRPWVIINDEASESSAISIVEKLALDLGATPVTMSAQDHDRAVALISHLPQIVASLLTSRLVGANEQDLALAGQGLRDTTRIAASDPQLWVQILATNSPNLVPVLKYLQDDVSKLIHALEQPEEQGALVSIAQILQSGNEGVSRIPGKHGGKNTNYSRIVVMIDDKPGELARLLTEIGEAKINIEDLNLDHASGAPVGLVELSVLPAAEPALIELLTSKNWKLAG